MAKRGLPKVLNLRLILFIAFSFSVEQHSSYGWMQLTYMRSVSFWGKFISGRENICLVFTYSLLCIRNLNRSLRSLMFTINTVCIAFFCVQFIAFISNYFLGGRPIENIYTFLILNPLIPVFIVKLSYEFD